MALVMALVIEAMRGTEVQAQIVAEARLEIVLPVAVEIARAIDLVTREIAAQEPVEIVLGIVALEPVPEIGVVASETVLDTAAEVSAQVAAGVPPAWVVRVGDLAEAEVAEVLAEVVVVVAVAAVGDSEVIGIRAAM